MRVTNLVQNKNYWNSAEKPLQNTVKNYCEKALGMPLQNLNKNYDRNNKNMQKKYKTQLKMKRPY